MCTLFADTEIVCLCVSESMLLKVSGIESLLKQQPAIASNWKTGPINQTN